jgi:ABC transport system ATP-binding/permease protein
MHQLTLDRSQPVPVRRGPRVTAVGLTTVHRNGARSLDDVTLSIEPGCLTAVIGSSGAGKTTLLAALAGVAPAQHGTVTLHRPDEPSHDTRIGFVPQDDILHGELPLRRTLRHAAALRLAAPTAHLHAAVDDAMEMLGLIDHADVRVDSLSGGQRKRASIASEILGLPSVCFLDEPTSGLDPSAAAGLITRLGHLRDAGITVVFSTHSVQDIERSDRVVVLARGGRLVTAGTPGGVLASFAVDTYTQVYDRLAA